MLEFKEQRLEPWMKKTLIIVGIIAVLIIGGFGIYELFLKNPITDAEALYTFELGKNVKLEPETFGFDSSVTVELENPKKEKINVSKNNRLTSKGKNYLDLGDYTVVFSCEDVKKTGTIRVEDTKAPKFTKTTKKITIESAEEKIDLSKYFKFKDNDPKTKLKSYSNGVDFYKAGKYTLKVYAEDRSKNKVVYNCKLKIKNDSVNVDDIEDSGSTTATFYNAFDSEDEAKKVGDEIVSKGGASGYTVEDTGFDTYTLVFENPTGIYAEEYSDNSSSSSEEDSTEATEIIEENTD